MWMAAICSIFVVQGEVSTSSWNIVLDMASFTASMTVNPLVTSLIVFKIFRVFREVKNTTTSSEKSLSSTGGRQLRSIIFIMIESGMALFAIQLARVVIAFTGLGTDAEEDAYSLIISIHKMLIVFISSVIVTLYSTDNVAARV